MAKVSRFQQGCTDPSASGADRAPFFGVSSLAHGVQEFSQSGTGSPPFRGEKSQGEDEQSPPGLPRAEEGSSFPQH